MTIRDDNSMVEYPLFQTENGGSIPTSSLQISNYQLYPCEWKDLLPILKKYHYRKEMIGGSIKMCLGVFHNGQLIGGGVLGNPWHPEAFCDNNTHNPIELRRLCFIDDAPTNTESWAISKICWWLRKYSAYTRVVSYSDTGVGHTGTIYKAANFTLVGESQGGKQVLYQGRKFHIRSLSIDRDYARNLALEVANGNAQIVDTGIKRIWVRDIAKPYPNAFTPYVPESHIIQSILF